MQFRSLIRAWNSGNAVIMESERYPADNLSTRFLPRHPHNTLSLLPGMVNSTLGFVLVNLRPGGTLGLLLSTGRMFYVVSNPGVAFYWIFQPQIQRIQLQNSAQRRVHQNMWLAPAGPAAHCKTVLTPPTLHHCSPPLFIAMFLSRVAALRSMPSLSRAGFAKSARTALAPPVTNHQLPVDILRITI